jgi:5-hydroxyisourate hydrolase
MGKLTTHILDTAYGKPAAGVQVRLYRIEDSRVLLKTDTTNSDGRLDSPMMDGETMVVGKYEIEFEIGSYFREMDAPMDEPAFVDDVVLRFGIANAEQHYHVPLLASPWSYSTYRGS